MSDAEARLTNLVASTGALMSPLWQHRTGGSAVATMRYWAGRPMLRLGDPIATAVGVHWIAGAWHEAGLSLGIDECDDTLAATLSGMDPPGEDLDDWIFTWLEVVARRKLGAHNTAELLPAPFVPAARGVGEALARCIDLVRSPPIRALLAFLRNRDGLTSHQAAQRCGLTTHRWRQAETRATGDPPDQLLSSVAHGFGVSAESVLLALAAEEPLPAIQWESSCLEHRSRSALELIPEALWEIRGEVPVFPRWLAPFAYDASCTFSDDEGREDECCYRSFAVGASYLYLKDQYVHLRGTPRQRPQVLADHIGARYLRH